MAKKATKEPKKEEIEEIYQYPNAWGQNEINQIVEVFQKGENLIYGDKTEEFEEKFAKFVGAKYCVIVNSGTMALYAALMISRKSYINTPYMRIPDLGSNEIFNAIIMSNFRPILCDINQKGTLDLRDQEAGIAEYFNGRSAKATIIEVCFDAINKHTPNLLSVYDFGQERHLTLGGIGGAVCTDDEQQYELFQRLRNNGKLDDEDDFAYWGTNIGVSELQAAFGLGQLDVLQKKIDSVTGFYNKIAEGVKDNENLVFLKEPAMSRIDVYTKDIEDLATYLQKQNIYCSRLPKPLHMEPIGENLLRMDKTFTNSKMLYESGIYLPSSPIMEEAQVDKIISVLQKYKPTK